MKIAVCVNRVPDTETRVKIGADGKTIDKTGVNYILNPYDEFAVEEALRVKEKFGGEVIIISLGGAENAEVIRKALAMGADKGILLKDDSQRDTFSIAKALSEVLREISPDIIFFGKQSIDYDDQAMPSLVGEFLGLPSITVVVKLEIKDDGTVIAEREIEGGREKVQGKLPIIIGAQRGLNEPRYPSLKGIMAAKSKPIEEREAPKFENKTEVIEMLLPPPKKPGRIIGTDASAVPELVRLLKEEAKVI
ncbi:electron transfer flavoprotein subunit beta/FixA family protein [Candidatus Kryptobacter tengchongensis]|uniref:electron transfer flavoprotein subunit beta/FixA family protein n=1 Tax=Kryptobacter tengchongensis TaxID=1643429 RepID=UPI00070831F7|nr:electron transfer flavoprotein subunit beta/FixA family protein [Candidatus Kryptobacter tengchongensis]CUS86183.1 electron transfer flavoprotein beta subunit [Candidatus Kryptobacter tengchongensis]